MQPSGREVAAVTAQEGVLHALIDTKAASRTNPFLVIDYIIIFQLNASRNIINYCLQGNVSWENEPG